MMTDCGKLMGYLAIPHATGVRTFLPVHCNRLSGHALFDGWESCSFTDDASGLSVSHENTPTLSVDERGCVVTP